MQDQKLKRVPINYLWVGLVLRDNLYNYNGEVLLIPKGEMITDARLQKLTRFEGDNKYITTYGETYDLIMNEASMPERVKQHVFEDQSGYTGLKGKVNQIMKAAGSFDAVRLSQVEESLGDIKELLKTVNFQSVFQCIDLPRPLDEDLQRHSLNVALLNGMMGEWLNLPDEDIRDLVITGVLHDIGKTKIPEEILNAPRALTMEEYEIMKQHPVYSEELLGHEFDEQIKSAVRHHHERVCGDGYPDYLYGTRIPYFARITAVSDVYDALSSRRSYKEPRTPFYVIGNMYEQRGIEGLDIDLCALFFNHIREQFLNAKVSMTDGSTGIVRYIPPNDMSHPVIQIGDKIIQTDEELDCTGFSPL